MANRAEFEAVLGDLAAEHADLDAVVTGLDEDGWDAETPAEGWAVRDQIAHLAFFDARAREALTDPETFLAGAAEILANPALIDAATEDARDLAAGELLEWWRSERATLLAAMSAADPNSRIPWYGPPMSAVSFATARLMETWAHGQDVLDAIGVSRLPTARLRHVAHIGVRALPFSFTVHGRTPPDEPVRVELRSPDKEVWSWGPDDADNVVRGNALDFCLVVTQRRHVDDARLDISGPVAEEWMSIAQAFAGPPGTGRKAGRFRA